MNKHLQAFVTSVSTVETNAYGVPGQQFNSIN